MTNRPRLPGPSLSRVTELSDYSLWSRQGASELHACNSKMRDTFCPSSCYITAISHTAFKPLLLYSGRSALPSWRTLSGQVTVSAKCNRASRHFCAVSCTRCSAATHHKSIMMPTTAQFVHGTNWREVHARLGARAPGTVRCTTTPNPFDRGNQHCKAACA